jgi:hypothetical protein
VNVRGFVLRFLRAHRAMVVVVLGLEMGPSVALVEENGDREEDSWEWTVRGRGIRAIAGPWRSFLSCLVGLPNLWLTAHQRPVMLLAFFGPDRHWFPQALHCLLSDLICLIVLCW